MEQTGLAWLGLAKLVIYFVEICVGTSGLSLLELDIIIAMHFTVRHYTEHGGHMYKLAHSLNVVFNLEAKF